VKTGPHVGRAARRLLRRRGNSHMQKQEIEGVLRTLCRQGAYFRRMIGPSHWGQNRQSGDWRSRDATGTVRPSGDELIDAGSAFTVA
jgi:hypothetical protein